MGPAARSLGVVVMVLALVVAGSGAQSASWSVALTGDSIITRKLSRLLRAGLHAASSS